VSTSPVAFPYPSPIATAVRAIKEANEDIAEVAQNVAEGLAEDVVKLSMAETAVKANAQVVRAAAEMQDEVIDILV